MQVSRPVHRAQIVEEHRKKQVFCASRQKKTDIFRYFLRSVVENDPLNPFFSEGESDDNSHYLYVFFSPARSYDRKNTVIHSQNALVRARLSSVGIATTAFLERPDPYEAQGRQFVFPVGETCFP